MRREFWLTILLLGSAALLFATPDTYRRRWRLQIFAWQQQIADANLPAKTSFSSEVPPARRLAELQAALARKDSEIAALRREIAQWRKLEIELPLVTVQAARLIAAGHDRAAPTVALNRGQSAGVEPGAAMLQGATLAGVVGLVEKNAAKALLLDHPGVLVPARASLTREACAVVGQGFGAATAIFYTRHSAARPGEKIFTSGLLGALPADIYIGTLLNYPEPPPGGQEGELHAPVRLAANFSTLERVTLVKQQPPQKPGGKP